MKSELTPGASLVDLQEVVYQRMLALRSIHRTTQQADFIKAYEGADEEHRKKLNGHIVACDRQAVERWLREQRQKDYAAMSLRELRTVGQRLGIPRYQHLPKVFLLSEIVNYEQAASTRGTDGAGSPDPQSDDDSHGDEGFINPCRNYGAAIRRPVEVNS